MGLRKNIAIDCFRLRDYGIGSYLQSMISKFKNYDEDYRFYAFCHPNDVQMLEELNPNIVPVIRRNFEYTAADLLSISRQFKKLGINLYHSVHFHAPLLHSIPIVITVHDMLPYEFPASFDNISLGKLIKRFEKSIDKATKIIAVSKSAKSDILKHINVDQNKIKVIYNGVREDFFEKMKPRDVKNFKERYQLNYPFILYAGNVRAHKNLERLIESMTLLAEEPFSDYRLVIAGYELYSNKLLRRWIFKHGLSERVRFLGYTENVKFLYKLASVFINPSLYEGFGVSILESMAVGTPVIASNKSALPEIAGNAALLVDPYDTNELAESIKLLIENRKKRNEIIKAGKTRASQFLWCESVKRYIEVYQAILG